MRIPWGPRMWGDSPAPISNNKNNESWDVSTPDTVLDVGDQTVNQPEAHRWRWSFSYTKVTTNHFPAGTGHTKR